jgi:hypothetical protein
MILNLVFIPATVLKLVLNVSQRINRFQYKKNILTFLSLVYLNGLV